MLLHWISIQLEDTCQQISTKIKYSDKLDKLPVKKTTFKVKLYIQIMIEAKNLKR